MAKISAKNAEVLISGYKLTTFASAYNVDTSVDAPEVTGFGEGSHNFIPGQKICKMTADMFWSSTAGEVHDALSGLTTGQFTLIPEGYTLGTPSLSMPFMQVNYQPQGTPSSVIKVGTLNFLSYGADAALYYGWALQHGTITDTTTTTPLLDPTNAARTSACGAVLHIWQKCAADTYVIKVKHCATIGGTYADLITFVADGSSITAERGVAASGTVNKYRQIEATRTGSAGNTLGFSVHFFFR